MSKTITKPPKLPDTYLDLVREYPLVSIKTEKQFQVAQQTMDLIFARGSLTKGEELYLDALSDLVAVYEDKHHSIAPASDADMLRHLLDTKGITQAELHRETGMSKSTISELLNGKRKFNKAIVQTLSSYFSVDASVLTSNI